MITLCECSHVCAEAAQHKRRRAALECKRGVRWILALLMWWMDEWRSTVAASERIDRDANKQPQCSVWMALSTDRRN